MDNYRGQRGFTLTELLVVIGIIALVSVITVPAMVPFLRGQRLRAGARTVQSAILAARTQAIRRRAVYHVQFDHTNQKMTIADLNSNLFGKEIHLPDTVSFSGAVTTVEFAPFGYATAGPGNIGMQDASGNTLTLTFQASTGQVRRPR